MVTLKSWSLHCYGLIPPKTDSNSNISCIGMFDCENDVVDEQYYIIFLQKWINFQQDC